MRSLDIKCVNQIKEGYHIETRETMTHASMLGAREC